MQNIWSAPTPDGRFGRWQQLVLAILKKQADGAAPAGDGATAPSATFEAFFWRYERKVFSYLWRMTGNGEAAFDLTQDVFVRAWRHFAEIRDAADAGPWLLRVATNVALTHLRHRVAQAALPLEDDQPGTSSDLAQRVAEQESVRQILLQLGPKQRSALVLFELYGFSCEEIGQALHMSRDAAKMTLWRAREQFRTLYLKEA